MTSDQSSVKANLAQARKELDAGHYETAKEYAQQVIRSGEEKCYLGWVLYGRAVELSEKNPSGLQKALNAFKESLKLKPENLLGLQGTLSVLRNSSNLCPKQSQEFLCQSSLYATKLISSNEPELCLKVVQDCIEYCRDTNHECDSLLFLTPDSPLIYDFLSNSPETISKIPHPIVTYQNIATRLEIRENTQINQEIGEQLCMLGSNVQQVQTLVKRRVFTSSNLEIYFQKIIDFSRDEDTDIRRLYEEKMFHRALETLKVLPQSQKSSKLTQVRQLAQDIIIVGHASLPAWNFILNHQNFAEIEKFDFNLLKAYQNLWPNHPMSRIINVCFNHLNAFTSFAALSQSTNLDTPSPSPQTAADAIMIVSEAFDEVKDYLLACRLVSALYIHFNEYEGAIDVVRNAIKLTDKTRQELSIDLNQFALGLNCSLATSLINFEAPKYFDEAKSLFQQIILSSTPLPDTYVGLGLILKDESNYQEAISYFQLALNVQPDNLVAASELAWCQFLSGKLSLALDKLITLISPITNSGESALLSLTQYRIACCLWDIDPSRASRKDRNKAYQWLIRSIQAKIDHAPSYTMLGVYYADFARDKKRARQCFLKAFELSASEVTAAHRLAKEFAKVNDWNTVELISRRIIDAGLTVATSFRRTALSWPYVALGVAQIKRAGYRDAIQSFLSALRINSKDYHSYVGLAEAYYNTGRHNSALSTLKIAKEIAASADVQSVQDTWSCNYIYANVCRELGQFDDAIEAYNHIIGLRPDSHGSSIELIQTLTGRANQKIQLGEFSCAFDCCVEALNVAAKCVNAKVATFTLWKAVGDTCYIFTRLQAQIKELPLEGLLALLRSDIDMDTLKIISDVDGISETEPLNPETTFSSEPSIEEMLGIVFQCCTLAFKRAIMSLPSKSLCLSSAWYNLGFAEYHAHMLIERNHEGNSLGSAKRYLYGSLHCFKQAICLESGNSDFWCALAVSLISINAEVSQHAFIRSLRLNERNERAWQNLATLYMLNGDLELAREALSRAQSIDSEYGLSWLGEGLVSRLEGRLKDALLNTAHAYELGNAADSFILQRMAIEYFDYGIMISENEGRANNNIKVKDSAGICIERPIKALDQYLAQYTLDQSIYYLQALYLERAQDYTRARNILSSLSSQLEAEYEANESIQILQKFAMVKADVARVTLGLHEYTEAVSIAEETINLLEVIEEANQTDDNDIEWPNSSNKIRLSSYLTQGLAHFFLNQIGQSLKAFRNALDECGSTSGVINLLAKVLWATGSEKERSTCCVQLSGIPNDSINYAEALTMQSVIAILRNDEASARQCYAKIWQCLSTRTLALSKAEVWPQFRQILTHFTQSFGLPGITVKPDVLTDNQFDEIVDQIRELSILARRHDDPSPPDDQG